MENLKFYNNLKSVPKDALKEIKAGRLKGKSDINPQWRYEKMTETFGPCGIGWKFEKVNQYFQDGANGEVAVFVDINLYVKDGDKWSEPIPGNGGSMFVTNERNGLYTSDEGVKMAITDALSTAMKMLGLAGDVYRGLMDSKYSKEPSSQQNTPTDNRPWLNPGTPQWTDAIAYLKGAGSIPAIEKKYKLSKQNKEKLQEESMQTA